MKAQVSSESSEDQGSNNLEERDKNEIYTGSC